jgi:LPXTG-motif cell wall-anchored protein
VPSTEPPPTVLALVVSPDPNSIPRTGSSSTGMLVFAGGALILAGLVTLRLGREQTGH